MDSLGDRMKEYERVSQLSLIRRMPAILRLDGRAFHTFTQGMVRPFDDTFSELMVYTTQCLMAWVATSEIAYSQSDEISILLKDYTKLESQSWFGGNIQKIVSISASIATAHFNKAITRGQYTYADVTPPTFDARVFNIPKEDVVNYFIWRQKDATRNSINAVGQANFSHKELQEKSQNQVLDMLHEKGINWNTTPTIYKRGFCVPKGMPVPDLEIPIFTENREYISRFLEAEV